MKSSLALLSLAVALALTGCDTIDKRIEKNPEIFAAQDTPTQERIKKGEVDVGFTQDAVYLALGAPDEKKTKVTAAGREDTWFYNNYYEDYEGSVTVGYRRFVVYNPTTKRNTVYFEPIRQDIYTPRVEERIRIILKDGVVAVIEQTK